MKKKCTLMIAYLVGILYFSEASEGNKMETQLLKLIQNLQRREETMKKKSDYEWGIDL